MQVGTALPEVTFRTRIRDAGVGGENPFRWQDRTTNDYFGGKTAILIGLPGAFTPTCSNRQLPAYDRMAKTFAEQGVDDIYCVSVNDAFVMNRWAAHLGLKSIEMVPDGTGAFTRRMGMLVRKDNLGFGLRSWRYAAVARNGVVRAWFEEPGLCDNADGDPYEASTPEAVLAWLQSAKAGQAT